MICNVYSQLIILLLCESGGGGAAAALQDWPANNIIGTHQLHCIDGLVPGEVYGKETRFNGILIDIPRRSL